MTDALPWPPLLIAQIVLLAGGGLVTLLGVRARRGRRRRDGSRRRPLVERATILLVEDEESVRQLLIEVLRREGFVVLAAAGGAEALAIVARHSGPIDLVLSDVVMPEMSGVQLAPLLERRRPGIKILFMSGYTDEPFIRDGIVKSGVAFLEKPFSPSVLSRKIREVLGQPTAA